MFRGRVRNVERKLDWYDGGRCREVHTPIRILLLKHGGPGPDPVICPRCGFEGMTIVVRGVRGCDDRGRQLGSSTNETAGADPAQEDRP